ncbi:MAG: hypothetical protein KAR13_17995 [Desulfobulbaceae bacterium]|nr:hypothetical protein [Desulfobulbaceae bacterium]MCK5436679.1 hypothetical protein [Desulfobulbaceae bacterium]MCK5544024.1 hypothetical protein [Desulfobulbaceae bacterium]
MNEIKEHMIEMARRRYDKISPCSFKATLDECFTVNDECILFWFNTEDNSTHCVSFDLAVSA